MIIFLPRSGFVQLVGGGLVRSLGGWSAVKENGVTLFTIQDVTPLIVGIVGALKGLATSTATGAASLIIPSDWTSLFATILTGATFCGALVAKEVKTVLQSRESVIKHPLFVIHKQLSRIK